MTHQNNYNLSAGMLEELTQNGLEAIPELMRVLLNSIMQAERAQYLPMTQIIGSAMRR